MSDRSKSWWARIRHEWTKNDGKPWEERAAGPDLKETVLKVVMVVLLVIQIAVVALTGLH